MVHVAANFRRTHSPSQLAWSEGWRPPGAQSTLSNEPGDFGHDDSTLNIVVVIIITITLNCITIIYLIQYATEAVSNRNSSIHV